MKKLFIICFVLLSAFLFARDYSGMYISDNSTSSTTSSTAGNWVTITGYTEMSSNGCTYSTDGITTGAAVGDRQYLVCYSLSFYGDAGLWKFGVSIGGASPTGILLRQIATSGTDTGNLSGSFITTISQNTEVTLEISVDASSASFTPVHSQLVIVELAEETTPKFAEMNIFNNTTSQSGISGFTTLTNFNSTNSDLEGWTYASDVLTASSGAAGTYLAILSLSFSGQTASPEIGVSWQDGDPYGGVNPTNIVIKRSISDTDVGNAGACGIISISEGHTIRVKAKSSGSITVKHANLTLVRIGDGDATPYADINISNNSNAINLPQSTWTQETNFTTRLLDSDYWSYNTLTDLLIPHGLSAGKYLVNYYLSVKVPLGSTSTKTFLTTVSLFNNSTQLQELTTARTLEKKQTAGNNPDVAAICGTAIIDVASPDDAFLMKLYQSDQSSDMDPTVTYADISFIRIKTLNDGTLPVVLTNFSAELVDLKPVIYWTTQSETENLGWNIYRSESENGWQNNDFLQINNDLIAGMGTTSQPTAYSFTDDNPVEEGLTYYYWLESVSYSQELELFGPISLLVTQNGTPFIPQTSYLYNNFPNPFNPQTSIKFGIAEGEKGILSIFNMKGQLILFREYEAGQHSFVWNAENTASGIYYYKLETDKFRSTRKMLLLK